MTDRTNFWKNVGRSVLLLVGILVASPTRAQDVKDLLMQYFAEVRVGKYPAIPKQLSITENSKATLTSLTPFLTDTTVAVRAKAYAITQLAGNNARQEHLRQDAVTKLIAGARDVNVGNAGLALSYLTDFRREDFVDATHDSLTAFVKRRVPHLDKIALLAGYLELTAVRDDLRAILQDSRASKKDRWASLLALARMGDSFAIDDVLKRVSRLPVNDEVVYEIFPDLVYTRQQAILSVVLEALKSDVKNCASANAEHDTRIPCGYRIMEQLAPAIEAYPLKLDASGDIQTKDYAAALQTVRDWFAKHPQYKVVKDRY